MSKAVKKVDTKAEEEFLAKKLGPKQEALKSPTQKLIINVSTVDENGKNVAEHIGKFHVIGTDLYSDTIKFHPISTQNKLIKMTKTRGKDGVSTWNYVNETVFFSYYGDDLYDRRGGIACGKVFGDARKALSKEEAVANADKAKSFLYLFGLAYFPGREEPVLVDFRIGGKRITTVGDAFSSKTLGKGKHACQFMYDLNLKPNPEGGVHPILDVQVVSEIGVSAIMPYDDSIKEYVDAHNARIMEQHTKYNSQQKAAEVVEDEDDNIDIGDDE